MPITWDKPKEEFKEVKVKTPAKPKTDWKGKFEALERNYQVANTKSRELENIIDSLSKPPFTELEKDTLMLVINNYIKGYCNAYIKAKEDSFSKVKKDYEKVLALRKKVLAL